MEPSTRLASRRALHWMLTKTPAGLLLRSGELLTSRRHTCVVSGLLKLWIDHVINDVPRIHRFAIRTETSNRIGHHAMINHDAKNLARMIKCYRCVLLDELDKWKKLLVSRLSSGIAFDRYHKRPL